MKREDNRFGVKDSKDMEELFDIIFDHNYLGIFIFQDNTIQYANSAWSNITGISIEEMYAWSGNEFIQKVHPLDRESLVDKIRNIQAGHEKVNGQTDWRFLTTDGETKWISMYAKPIVFRNKSAILGTSVDITSQKQSMMTLEESERKYRFLIEKATDAIFIAQDEKVKFLNPGSIQIVGYTKEEIVSMSFLDLIHPKDRAMVGERYRKRLQGEQLASTYSFRVVTKAGETLWCQLNTSLIEWQGRPATLNIARDITRQKQMEERLQEVQKMESIGRLAGGIAHDFNNLLMGIQGRASLILADLEKKDEKFEHLQCIEEYVKSASNLTGQLLGFARKGKYEVVPTNINQVVEKTAHMFGRTKKEIVINSNLALDLLPVEIDRNQMEQVLLNLYVNAWQAMPEGGVINLETKNTFLKEEDVTPHQLKPGKYVMISIADTGIGMDDSIKRKIFDPFFTTKGKGRGTGLGLASAYGIIKNHNGIIDVRSRKGKGTTFDIYLPTTTEQVKKKESIKGELVKGSGSILLVDDEEIIIDVGKMILERIGYDVYTASNGREAIETVLSNNDIDLVILDVIMPGLGGGEVFDRIKKIRPGLKVLLSSGYSVDGEATEILNRGCAGFIQKPFDMKSLSVKIKEII